MTTMTATPAPVTGPVTLAGRTTLPRAVASEWTKFRSLRSSWWTLAVSVLFTVGLGVLVSAEAGSDGGPGATSPEHLASMTLLGVTFAQLATGVLGVLLMSGEYGTGMIRSSMTVVPRRLPVLVAKLVVFATVVLPLSLATSLLTFWLGQVIRGGRGLATAGLGDPDVLRVIVGSALYVTVAGLMALGIGALLRHTAAGLAAVVTIFFVAPIITAVLPESINGYGTYLPSNAGGALWGTTFGSVTLEPWTGFAWLVGYTVIVLAAASWRLLKTDV